MGAKPRYSEEFKEHILSRVAKGGTPKRLSDEYDGSPSPAVIYKWMRDAGPARLKELKRAIRQERQPQATFGRYNQDLKEKLQEEFQSGNCQTTDYYVTKFSIHPHTIRRWAREVDIRLPRTLKDKPASRSEAIHNKTSYVSPLDRPSEFTWKAVPDNDPAGKAFWNITSEIGEQVALRLKEGKWYYRAATITDVHASYEAEAIEAAQRMKERQCGNSQTHNSSV